VKQRAGPGGWTFAAGVAGSAAFVATFVSVLIYFDLQREIVALLEWLDAQGAWAPTLFALILAATVVLLLPGVLLTTGAGFVFGIATGTVAVVLGTTIGAAIAFLIARWLLGGRARRYILRRESLRLLDQKLSPHAWQVVLFSRLIPFFPAKVANYFYGLTSVSFRAFIVGSGIGFVPFSLHNVFLGAVAAELSTKGLRTVYYGEWGWFVYGAGFVVIAAAVIYLARWAWKALDLQGVKPSGNKPE
jgi:uncharacterized membrane protein YdjX (TVP38/TMEM64 family)